MLVFRSVPSRLDAELGCTIDDGAGGQVGAVRSVSTGAWQRVDRILGGKTARYEFELTGADGAPTMCVRRPARWRFRDRLELLEIRGSRGEELGVLRQRSGYLSGHRYFAMEWGGVVVGQTMQTARPGETAVCDATDRAVGRVTRQRSCARSGGIDLYDYTLTFDIVPDESMRCLAVVAALAEYFYPRVEHGGPLRALLWWA